MGRALDFFYKNAVACLVAVAVVAGLFVYMVPGAIDIRVFGFDISVSFDTLAAFSFMLLGLMLILWDAHTDPHIPPAPTIT